MATERKVRTTRSNADYQGKDEISHILDRPDMYIGSTEPDPREELLLDITTKKLASGVITLPAGVERLFLEILSNAGDNADNSRRANVNPGAIHIYMDRNWIKIRNGGLSIPIEESVQQPGKLIPELIFGQLRTSSNYDPNVILMGCGKNGFGAKLTNVYSRMFTVTVGDNINHKMWTGTWENNMRTGPKSEVVPYNFTEGFVEVAWLLDFERFRMSQYPDEAFCLFARYAADFSLTCKIPVIFNEIELDVRSIRDYAMLMWSPEVCAKGLLHHEWPGRDREHPNGISPFPTLKDGKVEKAIAEPAKPEHIPTMEILMLDTPGEGVCLSYVNGMYTMHGGIHVNEVMTAMIHEVTAIIDEMNSKKKKKDDKIKILPEDIKRNLSIIINCRLPDPKYDSQSKTRLVGPRPHVSFPKTLLEPLKKWDLIGQVLLALEAKMNAALAKSNGGRVKHLVMDGGEDADEAGGEHSHKCILYLVEGKSASAYPKLRITMSEGGKGLGGYYPLRGKFMNIRNAGVLKIAENKEIKSIKAMLGLREDLDYSQPEHLATLRYGFIMICVDADSDGFHIASLLINYIDRFFKGLLTTGRVAILRTPVVRVTDSRGNILHRFYSNREFEEWERKAQKDGSMKNLKVGYFKGLGSSDKEEIKDDLTTAPVVTIVYDDQASDSLTIAFDKDCTDHRKAWINKWREVSHIHDVDFMGTGIFRQQYITNFINRELIDYTKDALFRAIPSQDDGLKRSHRQALYAALKYFNHGRKREFMGVSKFANYAASETNYHHGEMSMCDTVIKMTREYVGSNNIPWFEGKGQFGSRDVLGNDAASPRYIKLMLPKYIAQLYDEELISTIPKRVVDTEEVEPLFVPGVIPMHLVNGVNGIATGYSSYIPNFNYYEIITWCKKRCSGPLKEKQVFKPWFRGFKGEVFLDDKALIGSLEGDAELKVGYGDGKKSIEDDDEVETEEQAMKKGKGTGTWFRTRGVMKISKNKEVADLYITEVPVGVSIKEYGDWWATKVKERVISDFKKQGTDENYPNFQIKGYKLKGNPDPEDYKKIHLEKSGSLNNINLIDVDGYPTKYSSIADVLEVYAQRMLKQYGIVKDNRLEGIRVKMEDLSFRIHFITAVLEDKIKVFKRSKKEILDDMKKYKPSIPEKYLKSVRIEEFTSEELAESRKEYEDLAALFEKTKVLQAENLWYEKLVALETCLKKEKF